MTDFVDRSTAVRQGEELDTEKLRSFLASELSNLPQSISAESITVEQFPSGFSNLTYLLKVGDDEYVLRRPPFGNQVKSAHDMGREFRVLSALSNVYPLAPRPLAYCDDESVLGAPFYVMERRRGMILRRKLPADLEVGPDDFRRLSESFVDRLAELHQIDYQAAGLADLGKPEGYVARQVGGWTRRYQAAQTDDFPQIDELAAWLADNQPAETGISLIHNDFKYDNLVLDPDDFRQIRAVLDWEMCTIGDPLMDLGTSLGYWVEADDDPALRQFVTGPTDLPGNLTRSELVGRYADRTGSNVSDILFYYCFGLFKLAVIVQQIYYRYDKGHTSDQRFQNLNHVVRSLGQGAVNSIQRNSIS